MVRATRTPIALIVDDDPASAEQLFSLLEGQGFAPIHVAEADQAFEVLHQEVPGLIALVADSLDQAWRVLEWLRDAPSWAGVPVFVIGGSQSVFCEGPVAEVFRWPLDVPRFVREVKRCFAGGARPPPRLH